MLVLEQPAVVAADADVRQLVVVQGDGPAAAREALDEDFGHGVGRRVALEQPARLGIQRADEIRRLPDLRDRRLERAGQLRILLRGERLQMVRDDGLGQPGQGGIALPDLDQQAFAQIARGNAGRIEGLDHPEHRLDPGERRRSLRGDFGQVCLEKTMVVEAANDQLAELPVLIGEVGRPKLPEEVGLQRDGLAERVEHVAPPLLVLHGVGIVLLLLEIVVAPLVVQSRQRVDALLAEIQRPVRVRHRRRLAGLGDRRGLARAVCGRLGTRVALADDPRREGVEGDFLGRDDILDGGILLHLVLDHRPQFHQRQLQHLERLPQLRRQNHHLALLLR